MNGGNDKALILYIEAIGRHGKHGKAFLGFMDFWIASLD